LEGQEKDGVKGLLGRGKMKKIHDGVGGGKAPHAPKVIVDAKTGNLQGTPRVKKEATEADRGSRQKKGNCTVQAGIQGLKGERKDRILTREKWAGSDVIEGYWGGKTQPPPHEQTAKRVWAVERKL